MIKQKSIIEMNSEEAKQFLLKEESYINIDLPEYFDFSKVLKEAESLLENKRLSEIETSTKELRPENNPQVTHSFMINKDGKYNWREISLVHPVLYVDLVNTITDRENWKLIRDRFSDFKKCNNIICTSLPSKSLSDSSDKTVGILNWLKNDEQASIKNAIEYKYCVKTDINNCYDSIYTHAISWAINGKDKAKELKSDHKNLGNIIDRKIRGMHYGQTNGIPQGSVLFDLIAELVLGYIDSELQEKIQEKLKENQEFEIIRYRDDYRIFTTTKENSDLIVKIIAETLAEFNMHFNMSKTEMSDDIIGTSIKKDKLFWTHKNSEIVIKQSYLPAGKLTSSKKIDYQLSLQMHLLAIYDLAKKYPNSGSVINALVEFYKRIRQSKIEDNYEQLFSIISNLIRISPRCIPQAVAILSYIFSEFEDLNAINAVGYVKKLLDSLNETPNIGYIEIWLQRLSIVAQGVNDNSSIFNEKLCKQIYDSSINLWDNSWLDNDSFNTSIINFEQVKNISPLVPDQIVNLFKEYPGLF